jgi:hypothetical protein
MENLNFDDKQTDTDEVWNSFQSVNYELQECFVK